MRGGGREGGREGGVGERRGGWGHEGGRETGGRVKTALSDASALTATTQL